MASPRTQSALRISRQGAIWKGAFRAMASPCEVLIDGGSRTEATRVMHAVAAEARRIEQKFSRYRADSVVARIHQVDGERQRLDPETAQLIDASADAWELSAGAFDITSGVLREVWTFDGSDSVPSKEAVSRIMSRVGWDQVTWEAPWLQLPAGMQIDFGGIGKEYAVDRALAIAMARTDRPTLVNFGGDVRVNGPLRGGQPWRVGVDDHRTPPLMLLSGALASSGDTHRFLLKDGVRYSHILDARTGWPVRGAPRRITVAADTCLEAGLWATLATLRGTGAGDWLASNRRTYAIPA